jgi:hypothetical protein
MEETVARNPVADHELELRFKYHAPFGTQPDRYALIRSLAKDMAIAIQNMTPPSREQSLAFTALEECVMWANASIARRETKGGGA